MVFPDPRKVVGSIITAKAIHVTNGAECSRHYGANRDVNMIPGTVIEVINTLNLETPQTPCSIVGGYYDLGGGTIKRATLNI